MEARAARATLHAYLTAAVRRVPPEPSLQSTFDTLLGRAMSRLRLRPDRGRFAWHLADGADLGTIVAHVTWATAFLLASAARERLGVCADGDCGWLFLDTTKNHSRRWCSMAGCGSRDEARRYYHRRASSPHPPRRTQEP